MKEAREALNQGLAAARQYNGERSQQTGLALYHLAWLEFRDGATDKSLSTYEQACSILEEVGGASNPSQAWCLNDFSIVLSRLRRNEEAREKLQQAIDIWTKVLPPGHPHLASASITMGNSFYSARDFENALIHFQRALDIRNRSLPDDHFEIGNSICNIAYAEQNLGRWPEAEEHFKQGIAILEAAQGPNDRDVANNLKGLAELYQLTGRAKEALLIHDRQVKNLIASRGGDHLYVAGALQTQGGTLMHMKRFDEAETSLRRAYTIAATQASPESPGRAAITDHLALCVARMGRIEEAKELLEQVQTVFIRKGPGGEVVLSETHYFLSKISTLEGKVKEAEASLDRAIELRSAVKPENDGQLLYLQAIRQVRDNKTAALDLLRQALDQGYPRYAVDLDTDFAPFASDPAIQSLLKL